MRSESNEDRFRMINLIRWDGRIKGGGAGEGSRERKWKIILIALLKKKKRVRDKWGKFKDNKFTMLKV